MKNWIEQKTGILWGLIRYHQDSDNRLLIRVGQGGGIGGLVGFEASIGTRGFYLTWGTK